MLQFIDDMIGGWVRGLNVGIITWTSEEFSKSVDFLVLTMTIERNESFTNSYQKKLNFYQYITPFSNYPPIMIHSIIYSLL